MEVDKVEKKEENTTPGRNNLKIRINKKKVMEQEEEVEEDEVHFEEEEEVLEQEGDQIGFELFCIDVICVPLRNNKESVKH